MFSKVLRLTSSRLTFSCSSFFSAPKRPSPNERAKEKYWYQMKRSTYLNVAMGCFVFALCFAGIPIYRTFCEHMGLVGDSDKKEYTFDGSKINNLKKFHVKFSGESDPKLQWEFEPVQKEVVVGAAETAIVFYRLFNKEEKPIVGFSTYNISPEDCNIYFSKIQCFCFNQQLINPKEELLLPLFFYLEPEINDDIDVNRVENIQVAYTFLKSAKQNLAMFAAQEINKIQENKRKLNEIRAKKMNMTLPEYLEHLQLEESSKNDKEIKQDDSEEIQRLKYIRDFQSDLLKAEMISKEFEVPQINKKDNIGKNQAAS